MNNYTNINTSLLTQVDFKKEICIFTQLSNEEPLEIALDDAKNLINNIGKEFNIKSSKGYITVIIGNGDNYRDHHFRSKGNLINAYLKNSELKNYLALFEKNADNKDIETLDNSTESSINFQLSGTSTSLVVDLELNRKLFQHRNQLTKIKNIQVEKYNAYELYGQLSKSHTKTILTIELHNKEKNKSHYGVQPISDEIYAKYSNTMIDEEELPW